MASPTRQAEAFVGVNRSDVHSYIIPLGQDGSLVTPIDFIRGYMHFNIGCNDASGIQLATKMRFKVGFDDTDTMKTLYLVDLHVNVNQLDLVEVGDLPTTGAFSFHIDETEGCQRIQIILSKVTTAPVTLEIYGFVPTVYDRSIRTII